jgi:hypothetical protein
MEEGRRGGDEKREDDEKAEDNRWLWPTVGIWIPMERSRED